MKKLFYLTLSLLTFNSFAQTPVWVQDSAVMGPAYRNDVFYSMKKSTMLTAGNNSWHLAFSVLSANPPMDVLKATTIRINAGRGTEVYKANAAAADFLTFDTSNWSTWPRLMDSETDWKEGGLNSTRGTSPFDFGWGMYKPSSYHVIGDSVYVIKLGNGQVKKLVIDSLAYDSMWVFRYADLDNQNLHTGMLVKKEYQGKGFVYYNLAKDSIEDREPLSHSWDLLFTRYLSHVKMPGLDTFYAVTGVLANGSVECARQKGVNTDTTWHWNSTFSKNINTIGWDWKKQPMGPNPWTVVDSLCYFVKDAGMDIYKIVFTGFGGGMTGVTQFKKVKYTAPGIGISQADAPFSFGIFPNPAAQELNIVLSPNRQAQQVTLQLADLAGKAVYSHTLNLQPGINQHLMATSLIPSGVYVLQLSGNGYVRTQRVVVAH